MLASECAELASVLEKLAAYEPIVRQIADKIVTCFEEGGKVLACGNGGSAAEAAHFAEEFTGRYSRERHSLPGICLAVDGPLLTCIGNDYGYDEIFARQITSLGNKGDVLVVFTSSGNSRNIVRALEEGNKRGLVTVAILGKTGGPCKGLGQFELIVPSMTTARVQECHLLILHAICELVERRILDIPEES